MRLFGDSMENTEEYTTFIEIFIKNKNKHEPTELPRTFVAFSILYDICIEKKEITPKKQNKIKKLLVKNTDLFILISEHITNDINSYVKLLDEIPDEIARVLIYKKLINKQNYVIEENIYEGIHKSINILNDYDLYAFALNNDIELDENKLKSDIVKSINYKIYKLKMSLIKRDKHIDFTILKSIKNINLLEKILSDAKYNHEENFQHLKNDKIFCLLYKHFNSYDVTKEEKQKVLEEFLKTKDAFILEVFCMFMLENEDNMGNIVLVMYLCQKYKKLSTTIQLIYVFTLRYFCMYQTIQSEFKDMNIKNIQIYNTAYIWMDVRNVLKMFKIDHKHLFNLNFYQDADITQLEYSAYNFYRKGMCGCSLSCIKTIKNLEENISVREFDKNKMLFSMDRDSTFSALLDTKAMWFFVKSNFLTYETKDNSKNAAHSKIVTVFGVKEVSVDDLYKNAFYNIESSNFMKFFDFSVNFV